MNVLYLVVALATGAGIAVQAIINAQLRLVLGSPFVTASVQTIIGLALMVVLALAMPQPMPAVATLSRAPWWVWTGGLLGGTFVMVSILLTPKIGVALLVAALIVGQLTTAVVIDHYGWFGAQVIRVTPGRAVGVALLIAGVILIRRSG